MNSTHLIDEAVKKNLGETSSHGALMVRTGKHTGRAAKRRFVVERDEIKDSIDWGAVNKPFSITAAETLQYSFLHSRLYRERRY